MAPLPSFHPVSFPFFERNKREVVWDGKRSLTGALPPMQLVMYKPFLLELMQLVMCKPFLLELPPRTILPLGEIHGKACESSVELSLEYRIGLRREISDERNRLSVKETRGFHRWAEVSVQINSRRAGQFPFQLRLDGGGYIIK
jgi:hypothetical protein